jgi:methionyl-tRNA formyltransferase
VKVILVTSSLTYVKDNYFSLLKYIYEKNQSVKNDFCALILIRTTSIKNFIKAVALYFAGARNFARVLMKNFFSSLFSDRRIKLSRRYGVPVFNLKNINDDKSIELLKKLKPDLIINIRTRNIYKKKVLDIPAVGCINIHHGILPENRGTMCDLWAWIEKRDVGFSIHWMNEKIDDGSIISVCKVDAKNAKSYVDIPFSSSLMEREELNKILEDLNKTQKIKTTENKTGKINYTKTPDLNNIKMLVKQGIKL